MGTIDIFDGSKVSSLASPVIHLRCGCPCAVAVRLERDACRPAESRQRRQWRRVCGFCGWRHLRTVPGRVAMFWRHRALPAALTHKKLAAISRRMTKMAPAEVDVALCSVDFGFDSPVGARGVQFRRQSQGWRRWGHQRSPRRGNPGGDVAPGVWVARQTIARRPAVNRWIDCRCRVGRTGGRRCAARPEWPAAIHVDGDGR